MKTNTGLVAYAKAQIGRPYWYGTYGQEGTEALYKAKKKQYPAYYTASNFMSQCGQKVHDCVGLIKGYMWCLGPEDKNPSYASNGFPDVSANGLYNRCTNKSTNMSKMPDVPGIAVFMNGHVGVYVGGGRVVEARGHAYGVVETELNQRGWTKWAYIPEISYTSSGSPSSQTGNSSSSQTGFSTVTIDASKGKKKRILVMAACCLAIVSISILLVYLVKKGKL